MKTEQVMRLAATAVCNAVLALLVVLALAMFGGCTIEKAGAFALYSIGSVVCLGVLIVLLVAVTVALDDRRRRK